jgi:hypothetical protein
MRRIRPACCARAARAEAQPIFTDGRLNGCTVVFGALAKDFNYRQDGYVTGVRHQNHEKRGCGPLSIRHTGRNIGGA